MEIITGVERRRRWSSGEKVWIVAETGQPGVGIEVKLLQSFYGNSISVNSVYVH